jgi:hypothetical protein
MNSQLESEILSSMVEMSRGYEDYISVQLSSNLTKTCSECARSHFIKETLVHYCRKKREIISGPRKTAENCNDYGHKREDGFACYGLLGLTKG